MNLPEHTSDIPPPLLATQPTQLIRPAGIFPGFALPEAALHSIPLPAEFEELVRAASNENRVKTVLPKFFNSIFRRQGVVNTHTINALESVGRSLSQLAREIENRDRVLELLTAHLNSYGEHAQKRHLSLAHYTQQIAKQIEEVAGNLQSQMERDAAATRVRANILAATSRATELRLKELHERFTTLGRQADDAAGSTEQNKAGLQEHAERIAEMRTLLVDSKASSEAAYAQVRRELEARLAEERHTFEHVHADRLEDARQKIETLEGRCLVLESALRESDAGRHNALAREEALMSSGRASATAQKDLATQIDALRADLGVLAECTDDLRKRQDGMGATLGEVSAASERILPTLQTHLDSLAHATLQPQRQVAAGKALETAITAQTIQADGFYAALEARFRGPRSLIRERQSLYLPVIAQARARVETYPPTPVAGGDHPLNRLYAGNGVLDLGCGRGEWLELLKEQGVPALGVDLNHFFLQACRQLGCEVIDANLVEFLAAAPAETVTVITGFHIIEHLSLPVLQEVIRNSFRVLRRGGVAIFETPNPRNVLTSSLNFHLDPTHQRPVHPSLAQFILETGGFSAVRLDYLHAYDQSHLVGQPGDPLADRFNAYFHGPQDYAVIGVKP